MSYAVTDTVSITTDASGDSTDYSSEVFNGKLSCLAYIKTDFADGVDFTITSELTGQTLWTEANVNAAVTVAPRQATHSTAGVASLYAAAGEPVEAPIYLVNERVKIVTAQGGNVKTGAIRIIVA